MDEQRVNSTLDLIDGALWDVFDGPDSMTWSPEREPEKSHHLWHRHVAFDPADLRLDVPPEIGWANAEQAWGAYAELVAMHFQTVVAPALERVFEGFRFELERLTAGLTAIHAIVARPIHAERNMRKIRTEYHRRRR